MADLGRYFTGMTYEHMVQAVDRLNDSIRASLEKDPTGDAAARWHDPHEVAFTLRHRFPIAVSLISRVENEIYSEPMRRAYPGLLTGYFDYKSIFDHSAFPLDPGTFWRTWRSSTVRIGDVYLGTDKIGHFFDKGFIVYEAYWKARTEGADEAEAWRRAVALGTGSHPFYSEKGIVGNWTSGAYSNADLLTDYVGAWFYRNLTEPIDLGGRHMEPMLVREGMYWRLSDRVRRDSDFFTGFIFPHMDEALNPSLYIAWIRKGVREGVRERAANVIAFYADENGMPRPRWYFQKLASDLATFYGVDYGHAGSPDELITIANTCYPALSAARASSGESDSIIDAVRDRDKRRIRDALDRPGWSRARGLKGAGVLHAAIGQPELIGPLIRAGAAINATDENGRTPLHYAARAGDADSAALLLDAGARIDMGDALGWTALHEACSYGRAQVVALLLDRGAETEAAGPLGQRPIHRAARAGHADIVAMLIEHGADAGAADESGWTAMHHAAAAGATDVLDVLIRAGLDPGVPDVSGTTPLHLASRGGWSGAVALLLKAGAQAQAANERGVTPLHEAALAGDERIVAMLLAGGADPTTPTLRGQTPLRIAQVRKHTGAVLTLERAESSVRDRRAQADSDESGS